MQFGVNKHEYIIFKDNKIARARRESALCSLKNLQVLIRPNCKGNHVIICYNVHEKTLQRVKKDEILNARVHSLYSVVAVSFTNFSTPSLPYYLFLPLNPVSLSNRAFPCNQWCHVLPIGKYNIYHSSLQTNVVNWSSVLPLHLEENGCLTTR